MSPYKFNYYLLLLLSTLISVDPYIFSCQNTLAFVPLFGLFCHKNYLTKKNNYININKRFLEKTPTNVVEHNHLWIEEIRCYNSVANYIQNQRYINLSGFCTTARTELCKLECKNYCKQLKADTKRKYILTSMAHRNQDQIISFYAMLYLETYNLTSLTSAAQIMNEAQINTETLDYSIIYTFFFTEKKTKQKNLPNLFKWEQFLMRYMMLNICKTIVSLETQGIKLTETVLFPIHSKLIGEFTTIKDSQLALDYVRKNIINKLKHDIEVTIKKQYAEEFKNTHFNRNLLKDDYINNFSEFLLKEYHTKYDKQKKTLNFSEFLYLFQEDNTFRYKMISNSKNRWQLESYVNEFALWICYINILSSKASRKNEKIKKEWDSLKNKIDFTLEIPFIYNASYSNTIHTNLLKLIDYTSQSIFENYFLQRDSMLLIAKIIVDENYQPEH